ncbi:MAG: BamA/TamA family outer membrane protein [Nitritalea sp.]
MRKSASMFFFCLLLVLGPKLFAQEGRDVSEPRIRPGQADQAQTAVETGAERAYALSVLPLLYFTPETSLAFGAGAVVNFRTAQEDTYESQVLVGGAYTLLDQVLSYVSWRIFSPENRHLFAGEVGWYRYVYFFYGIGNEVQDADRELFDATFPRLRLDYAYALRPNFYLGLRYWYDDWGGLRFDPEGQLIQGGLPGTEGGRISGLGPLLSFESRDSQLYPTKGLFVETAWQRYGRGLGAQFGYSRFFLDARKVWSLSDKGIFVGQVYQESTAGDVPFFALPMLGGNQLLRGYFEGKYRGPHVSALQGEYRQWLRGRWGLVGFAGLGAVYGQEAAWSGLSDLRFAYGTGLRFRLSQKEKLNLRLDIAHAPGDGFQFYLTFGEAF